LGSLDGSILPRGRAVALMCARKFVYEVIVALLVGGISGEILPDLRPSATAARCAVPRRPRVRPLNSAYTTAGGKPCSRAHVVTGVPVSRNHSLACSRVRVAFSAAMLDYPAWTV